MTKRQVGVYQVDPAELSGLSDCVIVPLGATREGLREAVGARELDALLLDLDEADALNAVVECREIRPELQIVGITGREDVRFVIEAQRCGCNQIATKPIDANEVAAILHRLWGATLKASAHGRVFAVMGSTGGAGATSLSCYLAAALAAQTGGRSCLLDLDFDFGSVARAWDLQPSFTIADLASAGMVDPLILEKAVIRAPDNVDVVARPTTVQHAQTIEESLVHGVIDTARSVYPSVVIDLPRKLDGFTGAAVAQCTKMIIVLQLTVPAVYNARRLIDALQAAGFADDRYEFVVNRFRRNLHALTVESIEQQFNRRVVGVVPNHYQSMSRAFDVGEPLPPTSPVRLAIREIAERLCGGGPAVVDPAPTTSWWSRLRLRHRAVARA